jgi:hypothetical protein
MTTYLAMKKIIESGSYNKAEVIEKLKAFYRATRITEAQYSELMAMVGE